MLSGLPASGKSTRAKEIVAQDNWIGINAKKKMRI